MTIKLGVIGLSKNGGWAATDLIPPILQKPLSDRYAITAVSTSSSDSASASASHYSNLAQREIKAYHGSAEAISADPDVDLVVVSINVAHHAEAAMHAINAGKDIFVECPLGRNLAEGRSLMQAARQANVRAMVGLQGMNIPAYVKAREWIDSNKIGRVLSVSWYMAKGPEVPLGAPWTFAKYEYTLDAKNGATFLDIVVAHTLSTITHILGPLQTVNATNTMGHKEIILADTPDSKDARTVPNVSSDQFSISGIFESGALFSGQWVQLGKALLPGEPILVLKISGTEGNIRIESEAPFLIPPPSISLNGQKFDLAQENLAQTPTGRAWEAFANKEEGSYATFEDGVYAQALIAAIRKSDEEGRRVSVSEI